jgi:hypothetical protein
MYYLSAPSTEVDLRNRQSTAPPSTFYPVLVVSSFSRLSRDGDTLLEPAAHQPNTNTGKNHIPERVVGVSSRCVLTEMSEYGWYQDHAKAQKDG